MIGTLLASGSDPLSHVVQHGPSWGVLRDGMIGQGLWSFPVLTNHVFMQVVAALLVVWLIPRAIGARAGWDEIGRLVPRGWFGHSIEVICSSLRTHIFQPNLGKYTDTFAPYLWSLFFYILFCNVLGLIPLSDWFSWIPGHWVGGTATGNIFTTAALAGLTLILIVYNGLKYNGTAYVKHFFMGPAYIAWFIAILEMLGLLFKSIALCVRLFANMLAGHIVLAVFMSFIPQKFVGAGDVGITLAVIVGCILFNFLEILVAFLHAFIFTTLTAVFLGLAVNIHHDEHHEEHADDGHGHAAGGGAHPAAAAAH